MIRPRPNPLIVCSLASLQLILSSCSAADNRAAALNELDSSDSRSGVVAPPTTPYQARPVHDGGSIVGHVLATGPLPGEPGVLASSDTAQCGAGVPDASLLHQGDSLGNVVVWVNDVRVGRALPVDRRIEVVHEQCVLRPRVQAAVAGSTVNVRNEDAMVYRLTAAYDGRRDTLALFRMSDAGQVVPSERLAGRPGLVTLTGDGSSRARGWIAVFDHPYFTVTTTDGAFRIDSLPPGRYHVRAWHERGTEAVEREVEVRAGGETAVELKLSVR